MKRYAFGIAAACVAIGLLGQANAGDMPEQSYTKSPVIHLPALSGSPPSVPSQAASEPTPKAALGFEWASVFEQGKQVAPGAITPARSGRSWTGLRFAMW
ncbi:hypothetical protein ACVWZM_009047 [Bradyrhizobium sp. USDA 4501]